MSNREVVFSLVDVIDAIENASEDFQWFANIETGEVGCYVDPIISGKGYDEDAFESDEWLSLPDQFDRDDWRTMRDYAYALGGSVGEELLDAIHGSGAFRAFRHIAERSGVLHSWHAYKDERICELAIEWLQENGCRWKDDRHQKQKRDWRDLLPDAMKVHLRLEILDQQLSACKLADAPSALPDGGFYSITRTGEEVSVVCETARVPSDALACEDDLRAFKVCGPLDFSLVGILAKMSSALADAGVPLFAISTYDTDYILVKEEMLETAAIALRDQGCEVVPEQ